MCLSQDVPPSPLQHHSFICFIVCRKVMSLSETICLFFYYIAPHNSTAESAVCLLYFSRHVIGMHYLLNKCMHILVCFSNVKPLQMPLVVPESFIKIFHGGGCGCLYSPFPPGKPFLTRSFF